MFLSSPSPPGAQPCPKRGKMPKKMRLEYEYDVQTAAVAVTQLEPCGSRGPSQLPDLPSSPALSHQPRGEPLPTAAAREAPPEQTLCHLQQPSTQRHGHRSLWHRWVLEGNPLLKEREQHESSHACNESQLIALVWPCVHGEKQGRHVNYFGEQGGVTDKRNCPSGQHGEGRGNLELPVGCLVLCGALHGAYSWAGRGLRVFLLSSLGKPAAFLCQGGKGKLGVKQGCCRAAPSQAAAAQGSSLRIGFPKFRRLRDVWNKLLVTPTPTLSDSRGI